MPMSDADFIVLDATGGGDMLRACLDSIRAQTVAPREIIVFDNGSSVPVRIGGARVIRSETNIGFAAGVNEALRHSGAEYVAVVNNDAVLDRDWLAVTKQVLDVDEKAAAVQTVIRRDAETIDGAGIDISDGTFRQASHGVPVGNAVNHAWGVSATATLYRRAAIGERMFDPRFFAYYEDVELNARLHRSGWRTIVIPVVKATHRGSASAPILGFSRAKRLRTRNRYLVARMHRGVGRIGALLAEDARLLLRGRSSLRGIIEGLCSRL
jgi:GT2 family glycosyltransferase